MRAGLMRIVGIRATLALAMIAMPAASHAGEPCCGITAIDAKTQMVSARDMKTRRTFQFRVADLAALRALRVGQAVHADFTTMKVSVKPDGIEPCCGIVNLSAPAAIR